MNNETFFKDARELKWLFDRGMLLREMLENARQQRKLYQLMERLEKNRPNEIGETVPEVYVKAFEEE